MFSLALGIYLLDVDLNVVEEIWNHGGRFGTTGIGANLTFHQSKD
jgi:hypothetical protein